MKVYGHNCLFFLAIVVSLCLNPSVYAQSDAFDDWELGEADSWEQLGTESDGEEAPKKVSTAILTLKNADGVTKDQASLITDYLRTALYNTGKLDIMERERMQEILKEHNMASSEMCADESSCIIEMGQILGVRQLVSGSIGKVGSIFLINLRVIDIQTARVIKVISKHMNDIDIVIANLPTMCTELLGVEKKAGESKKAKTEMAGAKPTHSGGKKEASPKVSSKTVSAASSPLRLSIAAGSDVYIGETWWYYMNDKDKKDTVNRDFDTIVSHPIIEPSLTLIINISEIVRIDIKGGYGWWQQSFRSTPYERFGIEHEMEVRKCRHLSLGAGTGVSPQWGMIGIHGLAQFGGHFYSYKTDKYIGEEKTDLDDPIEDNAFGFSLGAKGGIDIFPTEHIAFGVDFLFRYIFLKTEEYYKIRPPFLGASGSMMFVF
jgi:TolB-like protein